MLPKISCVVFLCILGDVIGGVRVELEYGQKEVNLDHDSVPSYVYDQQDDEALDSIRIFRVKGDPLAILHTPSLQEVMRVRGAIKQMLSGNENVFTPITSSNQTGEKLKPDKRAIDDGNEQSDDEKYRVNIGTKHDVIEPTEGINTDTITTQASVLDDTEDETAKKALRAEENRNELDNDIVEATRPTRSSLSILRADVTPGDIDPQDNEAASINIAKDWPNVPRPTINERQETEGTRTNTTSAKEKTATKLNVTPFKKRPVKTTKAPDKTGLIVAKCYVCGLKEKGIPRHTHCADAFGVDFLPLMPFDTTARRRKPMYQKYCRYLDIDNFKVNKSIQSVYGRWAGGCSVRWTELSGAYTQRACRSARALLGAHHASARMAHLEMALQGIDNGCITSPMATLLPLSRGVSLYDRFHACVCSGDWCNLAPETPWPAALVLGTSIISAHIP